VCEPSFLLVDAKNAVQLNYRSLAILAGGRFFWREHCNFSVQRRERINSSGARLKNRAMDHTCNFSVNEGNRFVSLIFVPHLDAKIAVT